MTNQVLAFPAWQVNHLARPGTEGVIKPNAFIYNNDLEGSGISAIDHLVDLNYRKVKIHLTLMGPEHDVLCYRTPTPEGYLGTADRRSVTFSGSVDAGLGFQKLTHSNDARWFPILASAAQEILGENNLLRNREAYWHQLATSLKQGKFRYLCLSDGLLEQTELGVHFFLQINSMDLQKLEEESFKNFRWTSLKTLYEMHYNSDVLLDNTSLVIADHWLSGNRY